MGKDHDPAVTHLVDQLMVIQHPGRGLVMDVDLARLRVRHAGLHEAKAPHLEPLVPLLMFFVGVQLLDDLPPTFQVFEVVRRRVDPVRTVHSSTSFSRRRGRVRCCAPRCAARRDAAALLAARLA